MSNKDININIKLSKSFRGELYDITFTTKGNIFGELKNQQTGNTLTLEQLLTEFLIIQETTDDDKSIKRIIRTEFLLACYYQKIYLRTLFEKFTTFLNGGANENSAFIINVSGGNLVILFAYLIMDIKNKVVPKTLIDYFTPGLITNSFLEINDTIIDLANEVVTPSKSVVFSDLDFYIIKNINYKETTQGGTNEGDEATVGPIKRERNPRPTPLDRPSTTGRPSTAPSQLRTSNRIRTATKMLLHETSKEFEEHRVFLSQQLKKKKQQREKQKADTEKAAPKEAAAEENKQKILSSIEEMKKIPQQSSQSEEEKQGFCVYRIKTEARLIDYLDLVLEDWPYKDKEEPEPLKELKDTLLDFFIFYGDNPNYHFSKANTYITQYDYKLLHDNGLPSTIGTTIQIYPQLFQDKFLEITELSPDCKMHLNNLKNQKKIIEAAKNLNIYLLIKSLKKKYESDHYNLMFFLNELSENINNNLRLLNNHPDIKLNFDSLNDLRSDLVTELINNATHILYNNNITKAVKYKLQEYLTYYKSGELIRPNTFLRRSKSIIESNPQIDEQMKDAIINDKIFLYIPDAEIPVYTDEALLDYDKKIVEYGGKKLKKSKKKRNVYKKTRKKHNKKINIENSYSSKKLIKNKKTRKKKKKEKQ